MKRIISLLLSIVLLLLTIPAPLSASASDADPVIALTYIPIIEERAQLEGVVYRPDGGSFDPAAYRVTLYLQVWEHGTYYVKPYSNKTYEDLGSDGSFSYKFITGGDDIRAEFLHILLIPSSYTPTSSFNDALAVALDRVTVQRSPDGSVSVDPDRPPPANWQDSGKPLGLTPKADLLAMNIGFYIDGTWAGGPLSAETIRTQLTKAKEFCEAVRFYSAVGPLEPAYAVAKELGLSVVGTAWISGDAEADQTELDGLIAQCNAGRVQMACVGSETLYRGEQTVAQLIEKMNYVRQHITDPAIPVTTADSIGFFLEQPALRTACDTLFVNLYPYWSGSGIETAAEDFAAAMTELRNKARGKEILISETGWPTAGQTIGAAVASEENAARYFEELHAWSLESGIPIFWFEFSDEPYKAGTGEGSCGAHWGFLDSELVLKPAYAMTDFFIRRQFRDVPPDSYYANAVYWAIRNGVTKGTSEHTFSPKSPCTREQVVTFLYAAAGSPPVEEGDLPFTDVKPGKYYENPVRWAKENGITSGVTETLFGVGQSCTRAQIVTFLWTFAGSPEPETAELGFTDVNPDAYYYKALCWAYETGVTAGTSDTAFSPKMVCTRAQVVTFLYKLFNLA